jgi:hypothetical protein
MLYIYALLGAIPREIPAVGIQGAAVRVARCGNLFAAVSEIAQRPDIQEQALREHEQTVRRLAEFADAILPARFGSVVAVGDSIEEFLQGRELELRRALTLVAGCEQMTLRLYGELSATAPVPTEQPANREADYAWMAPALGPGARYLTSKVRDKTVPGLDAIRLALTDFVRAEQIQHHGESGGGLRLDGAGESGGRLGLDGAGESGGRLGLDGAGAPPLLASVYHLIERGRSAEYKTALDQANSGSCVRVAASGPWPPYAFGRWEN